MKNLFHQTKQAFFFSLVFYISSILLMVFKVSFAPMMVSISLLISLIWVFLVLREIMLSTRISNAERMVLMIFIVLFNIIAGVAYFFLIRERVTGLKK